MTPLETMLDELVQRFYVAGDRAEAETKGPGHLWTEIALSLGYTICNVLTRGEGSESLAAAAIATFDAVTAPQTPQTRKVVEQMTEALADQTVTPDEAHRAAANIKNRGMGN